MKHIKILFLLCGILVGGVGLATANNYYCKNCGQKFPSVQTLTAVACMRHPNGTHKGKHALYEGSSQYVCKYCATPSSANH